MAPARHGPILSAMPCLIRVDVAQFQRLIERPYGAFLFARLLPYLAARPRPSSGPMRRLKIIPSTFAYIPLLLPSEASRSLNLAAIRALCSGDISGSGGGGGGGGL